MDGPPAALAVRPDPTTISSGMPITSHAKQTRATDAFFRGGPPARDWNAAPARTAAWLLSSSVLLVQSTVAVVPSRNATQASAAGKGGGDAFFFFFFFAFLACPHLPCSVAPTSRETTDRQTDHTTRSYSVLLPVVVFCEIKPKLFRCV